MPELEGSATGAHLRICVIASRWNGFITNKLLEGAAAAFREAGVPDQAVTIVHVPGSFEVPTAAQWAASSGQFDAIVALGCVIRGETAHFEYVAGAAADGIARVSLDTGLPVIFGVLTVDSMEQALARAGGREGNKGEESARAAIEMANLRPLFPR